MRVGQNAKVALVQLGTALAECDKRRSLGVSAYDKVLLTFGVKTGRGFE